MPSRKLILVGLVGIGGLALLADRTFVSSATAQVTDQIGGITGLVAEAQKASTIAQSLNSGDPVQIQDLLENLVTDGGATPENTSPGLFQLPGAPATGTEPADSQPDRLAASRAQTEPVSDHVSSIITTPNGGLAVINGAPMRTGDSVEGCTLLAVHPDRVVIERGPDRHVLRLDTPSNPVPGPSVRPPNS